MKVYGARAAREMTIASALRCPRESLVVRVLIGSLNRDARRSASSVSHAG